MAKEQVVWLDVMHFTTHERNIRPKSIAQSHLLPFLKVTKQIQGSRGTYHTINLMLVSLLDETVQDGDSIPQLALLSALREAECVLERFIRRRILRARHSQLLEELARGDGQGKLLVELRPRCFLRLLRMSHGLS